MQTLISNTRTLHSEYANYPWS